MLRTTMLALAAAVTISGLALGSSAASAAPVVAVRVYESGPAGMVPALLSPLLVSASPPLVVVSRHKRMSY